MDLYFVMQKYTNIFYLIWQQIYKKSYFGIIFLSDQNIYILMKTARFHMSKKFYEM